MHPVACEVCGTAVLAEAGCSDEEIAAITGHKSKAMIALCTQKARQKKLALSAIAKMEKNGG